MTLLFHIAESYPLVLQATGVVGFLIYVGGFFLVQNGTLCGNGVLYPMSKVIAAGCVLISLITAFNLASFLIQVSYIAIGLYGMAIRWRWERDIPRPPRDTPHIAASRHIAASPPT